MLHVEDKPETLHIYVVREEAPKPSLLPIFLSVLALASLVALSIAIPYKQSVTRAVIRVPAVLLPLKTFTATAAIIPTGVKVYPATTAHGVLTITNGSVIAQVIPTDFTVQNVTTDRAVYVPAGSANGYGYAIVAAHALKSGHGSNLSPYSINSAIGSSVYIRNLSAFSGGRDAYSVKFVTAHDKQKALTAARNLLAAQSVGLRYPCTENISGSSNLQVVWVCQFVTYKIPSFMSVSSVRIVRKNLLLDVWYVARPAHVWVK